MALHKFAQILFVLIGIFYLLSVGKTFIVPILLAFVFWYLINSLNDLIRKIKFFNTKVPQSVGLALATILFALAILSIGTLVVQNINSMLSTAPDYKISLESQLARILSSLNISQKFDVSYIAAELDLNKIIKNFINSFSIISQRFFLIILYVIFLLVEQNTFPRKFAALQFDKERKLQIIQVLQKINTSIRTYLSVKFIASLSTAVLSYFVILYAGVDFALFWAFLIFLLNFIPTIGSMIATLFPSLVALVQFDYLSPFFICIIGVGVIQILIGGILEPRLYGNSLNISPFIVIVALVLWGMLWGIVGMLLCIPITVISMLILAQFPKTRPIAILLSRKGRI